MQVHVLDEAKKANPDAWWWIKADGCDILPGVAESTKGIWSGDVDLNDGYLEEQKAAYKNRLPRIEKLHMDNRHYASTELCAHFTDLQKDKEFLHSG